MSVSGIKNFKHKRDSCVHACVRAHVPKHMCACLPAKQSGEFGWAAVELLHLTLTNVTPFREIKHMNVSEI